MPSSVLQINPIASFYNHSDKSRSFELWQEAGIPCPEFITLPEDISTDDRYQIVYQYIKKHGAILLRTNNEALGNGLYSLDSKTSRAQILSILNQLDKRVNQLKLNRKDSKIIAVKCYEKDKLLAEARVYVVGNQLLTEACYPRIIPSRLRQLSISKQANSHEFRKLLSSEIHQYPKLIREANNELKQRLIKDKQLAQQCMQAVNILGNNIGAVDLLFCKNKPIFLEINPMFAAFGNTSSINRTHCDDLWQIRTEEDFFEQVYAAILRYHNSII